VDGVPVGETGPGDGTVPLSSSTHGGTLPFVRVTGSHATLPLEHDVVAATLDAVARLAQRDGGSRLPAFAPLDLTPGTSRGALLTRFDEPDEAKLRIGELASLLRVV
jgi:hypothetical protein